MSLHAVARAASAEVREACEGLEPPAIGPLVRRQAKKRIVGAALTTLLALSLAGATTALLIPRRHDQRIDLVPGLTSSPPTQTSSAPAATTSGSVAVSVSNLRVADGIAANSSNVRVFATPRGFAAIGLKSPGPRLAAWVSDDGVSWSDVPDQNLPGNTFLQIHAVISRDGAFFAFGDTQVANAPDLERWFVWRSVDGSQWTAVADVKTPAGGRFLLSDVFAVGPRLVAVAVDPNPRPDSADSYSSFPRHLFTSTTGLTWEEISTLPGEADGASSDGRYVYAIEADIRGGRRLWRSSDTQRWEELTTLGFAQSSPSSQATVGRPIFAGAAIFIETTLVAKPVSRTAPPVVERHLWRSADGGRTFGEVAVGRGEKVAFGIATFDGVIMIEERPEGQKATLSASRDGLRWQVVADLPADKCCLTALARNGRSLVMVIQASVVLSGQYDDS